MRLGGHPRGKNGPEAAVIGPIVFRAIVYSRADLRRLCTGAVDCLGARAEKLLEQRRDALKIDPQRELTKAALVVVASEGDAVEAALFGDHGKRRTDGAGGV